MVYRVLARRLRPQEFSGLLGQEEVVQTLKNAIKTQRVGCAYLFYGPRGTGKTTVARIFSKCLNCEKGVTIEPCQICPSCIEIKEGISMDVHEIDGATYTQVDKIREIKEMVYFQPARDRYKIYIIDEVHMLSQSAFNAILKLLEEPPPHAIFIFATTEKHKIPATIISRCQVFNFHLFSTDEISNYLKKVVKEENIKAKDSSLLKISRKAQGSIRDALSILDQVIALSGNEINDDLVAKLLGDTNFELMRQILNNISEGKAIEVLKIFQSIFESGEDLFYFYNSFLHFLRYCIKAKLGERELSLSDSEWNEVKKASEYMSYEELLRTYSFVMENQVLVNRSEYPYVSVELIMLKLCELPKLKLIEDILKDEGRVLPFKEISIEVKDKSFRERLIEEVEKKSKPLAGYLQASYIKEDNKNIIISFKQNFKKAYEKCKEKENLKIIDEKIKELLGDEFEISFILETNKVDNLIEEDNTIKNLKKYFGANIEEIEYIALKKEEENNEY